MSRYELESRIATGGMGEVWRGRDSVLERPVAVKLLRPEYADDATFRARFETEARNAASLHHPNIASVFDFGEHLPGDDGRDRPYLVMELVDGRPLSELIKPDRPMVPEHAVGLVAQAADALAAAHAAGIVHRDVKPANLLVTPSGQVKVTDFGIARATDGGSFTSTGEVLGTPHYFSPEQAQGRGATPASDVYALGVVLFECLAGRRPFTADSPVATALAHVRNPVPELPESVPAGLASVVRRSLAKDPAARFPDAGDFAAAIRDPASAPDPDADGAATQLLPATPTATQPVAQPGASQPTATQPAVPPVDPAEPATTKGRRGLAAWWPVLVVLVLALVVGGYLLLTRGSSDTPDAKTAHIENSDFVGLTEKQARDQLATLGFHDVRTDQQDNPGNHTEGRVSSVAPRGTVPTDSTITLSLWGPAPAKSPTPTSSASQTPTQEPSESSTPTPTATTPSSTPTSGSPSATGTGSP